MIHSIFSFRSFVYVVYAVLLTAVLLYVRFPAEQFKQFCERRIENILPESTCTIDQIGYRFPFSAVYKNIALNRVIDGQETAMVVDQLVISADSRRFWRAFSLNGKIYSGLVAADLDFDRRAHSFALANIHVEGLQVGDLAKSIGLSERKISGIVKFSGDYKAPTSAPGDGNGKGVIEIAAGNLSLLQPILNLSILEFDKLAMRVTHEKGVVRLNEGEFLGREILADFTGELRLASPFLNSNISLSGHMEPDEGFLRSNPQEQQAVQSLLQRYKMTVLPFKLGGTVQRPLFRFST